VIVEVEQDEGAVWGLNKEKITKKKMNRTMFMIKLNLIRKKKKIYRLLKYEKNIEFQKTLNFGCEKKLLFLLKEYEMR